MKKINLVLLLSVVLCSCASVKTEGIRNSAGNISAQSEEPLTYPPYEGEAIRVQVVQFRIAPEVLALYPQLADKQVGLGLSGRVVDELYETKRFALVEGKEEIQQKVIKQWVMSQSGIVSENQQVSNEGLSAPEYLVYVELIDFSVSKSEQVVGIALEKQATTRVTFQLRFLDIASGEFIPSSGTGEATTSASAVWVNPQMPFDQTTVGLATQRAVKKAVLKLLNRI